MSPRFGRFVPRERLLRGSLLFTLALMLVAAAAACGSGGTASRSSTAADSASTDSTGADSTGADSTATQADDEPEYPYKVLMRGMLRDTLRGSAEFGLIFDPVTRREQWVLSMRSGADETSGVYLARPDTARPASGTYQIVSRPPVGAADSMRAPSRDTFTMIYRAGMRRTFHSQSGTLKLTTANDTLLEGTFDVTLNGTASLPGQPPREGTLTMKGDFRAEKGTVGFLFGV